jgi:hypothetical protein
MKGTLDHYELHLLCMILVATRAKELIVRQKL